MTFSDEQLLNIAKTAKENAYVPYSGFHVGAALLTAEGKVYTGCNIENASYTPTVCAERVAFFKAVSDGAREFLAIAVAGDTAPCPPCGVCRQVMAEFCSPDLRIILEGETYTLAQLLPASFGPGNLQ